MEISVKMVKALIKAKEDNPFAVRFNEKSDEWIVYKSVNKDWRSNLDLDQVEIVATYKSFERKDKAYKHLEQLVARWELEQVLSKV